MRTLASEADYQDIVRRLGTLSPDSERKWGRMTAHEVLCHLSDSLLGVLGRRTISEASGPLQRSVVKWMALYAPFRWPRGVPTRPEVQQGVGGTPPVSFAADQSRVIELTREFRQSAAHLASHRHPIFGRMSEPDWMRWAFLHADHHLRQFEK